MSAAADTPPPPPNNNNGPVRGYASDKASAVRSMGGFAVQGDSSDEEYDVPAAEAQMCLPCIERLIPHLLTPYPRLRRIVCELVLAAAEGDHIVSAARAKTAELPGRRVRLSAPFRQLGDTWRELYNAARTTPADVVPATPLTPAGGTARGAAAVALPSTPGDPMGALVLASQALTPSHSGGVQQQQLQMLVRGFAGAVQGLRDHQGAQDARLNSFELVQQQQSGLMAAIHEELVAARRVLFADGLPAPAPPLYLSSSVEDDSSELPPPPGR
ncbi:hypothetical protein DCS_05894 [Drechmeria coniospora]|uniref:Uncharacterized protein n=1 Tax=Drechmeria coniospora TaxID=98403 RepID=A0A151GA39_DRECN|nr:hypothetical protein DCS_05894 [Drechmeria coniospora]KYK53945.1 hypothetical protein DCS_05894 [Drechmeria coniospora]